MHLHAVVKKELAQAASKADDLRAQARAHLITAVADAHQAGLTQREIGAALSRSQPEVSRLLKLAPVRFRPNSNLGRHLVAHRREVIDTVERWGADNVRVFGSLARGEDDEASDIDLLVDIPADFSLGELGGLRVATEAILGHRVDIVPARGLRGRIRDASLSESLPL
jgi:predicted nucleotidyltransferase/predicted XRE-type DNA-binding protein